MGKSATIFAGGHSVRFGEDKARAMLGTQTLVERVWDSCKAFDERFIIGGATYPKLRQLQDPLRIGPLGALQIALEHARFERVAVAACDLPMLNECFWHHIAQYEGEIVVPLDASGHEAWLAGIYDRDACLPLSRKLIGQGKYAMADLAADLYVKRIPWSEVAQFGEHLLYNINRKADLEGLKRALAIS